MTESHKRPHRHPKYKTAYRVKNWRQYAKALRDRGDMTLWLRQDAIDAWTPPMTGKRGAQPVYSDLAIETARTLRFLLHLPLRQTEGWLGSGLQLMEGPLPCPKHTTLSRRPPTVAIRQQIARASAGPLSLIVASSGLQVCGQGAWRAQQHGAKQPKRWKKRYIGGDAEGQMVASAVTASSAPDPSHVPALLSPVDHVIARFIGDGMYDQEPVYAAVRGHAPAAWVIVPPRKDAGLRSVVSIAPPQRDQQLLAIEREGRFAWKRSSGYYAQADAEPAFSRLKRTCGDHLRAKRAESPEWEASLACQWLKRMRDLGRPQSYAVS